MPPSKFKTPLNHNGLATAAKSSNSRRRLNDICYASIPMWKRLVYKERHMELANKHSENIEIESNVKDRCADEVDSWMGTLATQHSLLVILFLQMISGFVLFWISFYHWAHSSHPSSSSVFHRSPNETARDFCWLKSSFEHSSHISAFYYNRERCVWRNELNVTWTRTKCWKVV